MQHLQQYPMTRLRRLRQNAATRRLVAESTLTPKDLIYPVFVAEGSAILDPISSMPGQFRYSIDNLIQIAHQAVAEGISGFAIFPVIDSSRKCEFGKEAFNPEGLVPRIIARLKREVPELLVISDIALDPYTSHGQDGILNSQGDIDNDRTIDALVEQALLHAHCGADIIAPSDMMDGRIGHIRSALEKAGFTNTLILSYAAKYASSYYGPFRDAVGSLQNLGRSNKKSYQMDPANGQESLREVALDIQEGADMIMVKPGGPYLDIVYRVKQAFGLPTMAYQVSGEYSMIKAASLAGYLQENDVIMESLLAFKRAGADAILTYFAMDAAKLLNEQHK